MAVLQISVFTNLRIAGIAPNIVLVVISIQLIESDSLINNIISSIIAGLALDITYNTQMGISAIILLLFCLIIYLIKRNYLTNYGVVTLLVTVCFLDAIYNIENLLRMGSGVISNISHVALSGLYMLIVTVIYILTFRTYGWWKQKDMLINR